MAVKTAFCRREDPFAHSALTLPLPIGQLEALTPPPPVGGVGVGWGGTVVGGVDVEGDPPPPQERARRENSPRAATAGMGIRLRKTSMGTDPLLNAPKPGLNAPIPMAQKKTVPPSTGHTSPFGPLSQALTHL